MSLISSSRLRVCWAVKGYTSEWLVMGLCFWLLLFCQMVQQRQLLDFVPLQVGGGQGIMDGKAWLVMFAHMVRGI